MRAISSISKKIKIYQQNINYNAQIRVVNIFTLTNFYFTNYKTYLIII